MSTGLRKILLKPLLRRGERRAERERETGRRRKRKERSRREKNRNGEKEGAKRKEEEYRKRSVLPMAGGVMSHRPVILKLPFNIPAASVVTRKEVRGHTMIVEATT